MEVKPVDGPALEPFLFEEGSCDSWDETTGTCSINLLDVTGTDQVYEYPAAEPEVARTCVVHWFLPIDGLMSPR